MTQPERIVHTVSLEDEDEFEEEVDLYSLIGEAPVELEKGYATVVIFDNLPNVPKSKLEKLERVCKKKIFSISGQLDIITLYIPLKESGDVTAGFAFVEYATAIQAKTAIEKLHRKPFDKKHLMTVTSYNSFAKLKEKEPSTKEWDIPERLWDWLSDEEGRDQYVTRYNTVSELHWYIKGAKKSTPIHRQDKMSTTYYSWSPYGTYLGTFHPKGVILWCGPEWKPLRFNHPGAEFISYSPKENYLVTRAHVKNKKYNSIVIWDIRTGEAKFIERRPETDRDWPSFQWSYDEQFFAKLLKGTIFVYETATWKVHKGAPFKIKDVQAFSWSKSQNLLVCWTPAGDDGNIPAKIMMIQMPARKVVRFHNLFNVEDCKLLWHDSGKYLCAKVDRLTKNKKKNTSFELCRVEEKDIPIDTLDMVQTEVIAFSWEPKGDRFAVIKKNANKHHVGFYSMENGKVSEIGTLEKRSVDCLFWSPNGRFILLAGLEPNMGGTLEFYDVDKQLTMRTEHHSMMTDVQWDPSGRYVTTTVSAWKYSLENGFTIWDFQGKEQMHFSKEKFYEFVWRPRPPTPLSKEELDDTMKNLKQFTKRVRRRDIEKHRAAIQAKIDERQLQRKAFLELRAQRQKERQEAYELRRKLAGDLVSDDEELMEFEEEFVEVLSEVRTPVEN